MPKVDPEQAAEAINLGDACDIRDKTLAYLRLHRAWYSRWYGRYVFLAHLLGLGITVLSFTASLIAAFKPESELAHYSGIILPACVGLFSTFLTQFRIRDNAALRDAGRIEVEGLICRAYQIPMDTPERALAAAMALRLKAHEIERKQSQQFFRAQTRQAEHT